ncbi:MAG: hypothetical protein NVSMB51_19290 [Solirubrobacteraceae bacterium]
MLLGAYLNHLQAEILALIDAGIEHQSDQPADAIRAIFRAITEDVSTSP